MNANKRMLQWGVASLLLILACACGGRSNIPLPPIEKRAEYKLPIIDYDFDGGVNKIIKFEAQQGHRYNMAESDYASFYNRGRSLSSNGISPRESEDYRSVSTLH